MAIWPAVEVSISVTFEPTFVISVGATNSTTESKSNLSSNAPSLFSTQWETQLSA